MNLMTGHDSERLMLWIPDGLFVVSLPTAAATRRRVIFVKLVVAFRARYCFVFDEVGAAVRAELLILRSDEFDAGGAETTGVQSIVH